MQRRIRLKRLYFYARAFERFCVQRNKEEICSSSTHVLFISCWFAYNFCPSRNRHYAEATLMFAASRLLYFFSRLFFCYSSPVASYLCSVFQYNKKMDFTQMNFIVSLCVVSHVPFIRIHSFASHSWSSQTSERKRKSKGDELWVCVCVCHCAIRQIDCTAPHMCYARLTVDQIEKMSLFFAVFKMIFTWNRHAQHTHSPQPKRNEREMYRRHCRSRAFK